MSLPLETERLILREPSADDFDELYKIIWSDPEVMRFVADGRTRTREKAKLGHEKMLVNFADSGMGSLVVVERADGRIAGECGVIPVAGVGPEIELYYTLGRNFWGRGLATEAAAAVLHYAMTPRDEGGLGLRKLIGITYPDNEASQRVLTKIGMRRIGPTDQYYDIESILFMIARR